MSKVPMNYSSEAHHAPKKDSDETVMFDNT